MDFTTCKISSEFIILLSAESIARSRGHDSGPASAHVRTPRLITSKIYAKNIFQLYKYSIILKKPIYRSDENSGAEDICARLNGETAGILANDDDCRTFPRKRAELT